MAYFKADGCEFHPQPFARSQWSAHTVNGSALAGLAAHAIESGSAAEGYRPAKFNLDIFRQPSFAPLTVSTEIVREGRTIRMADAVVRQGDRIVGRASLVSIMPSRDPAGARWQPGGDSMPFPESIGLGVTSPGILWGSDVHPDGWSTVMQEHQNSGRKRLWFDQPQVVAGVEVTPFVRAVMVGELANTLTSWGDRGIGFINHDVAVQLARLPIGDVVGIEADNHIASDGIAVGTASMWDRQGRFGISTTGAVAHLSGTLDSGSGPDDWAQTDSSYAPDFDPAQ